MAKKWFKAKKYGYGWTPSSWQGWLILTIYCIIIAFTFLKTDIVSRSISDTFINFVPLLLLWTLILILICYITGEEPRWQGKTTTKNSSSKRKILTKSSSKKTQSKRRK